MEFERSYYAKNSESLEGISSDEMLSMLKPKTEKAITLDGIKERLDENGRLNVKFGTDPTGPDLHLGHIVPIRVLDLFSRAGHNVDLIFGDFTAKVGDPTGRSDERPLLTDEMIAQNMSTFRSQVDRYFDTNCENVRIHQNSHWLGKMALASVFEYLQAINLSQAMQREDFRSRANSGKAVSLAEVMYGAMMGIDSVHLDTDIEIGGVDQLLNFQQTRDIQRARGSKAEGVIMTPIIEGTSGDGRKMSKSYGNYIPVRADSDDVFGKFMSIPDTLIVPYIKAFAPVSEQEIPAIVQAVKENPMEMKKQLATYMVSTSAGSRDTGLEARETFERKFADKNITVDDATPLTNTGSLIDVLLSAGDFKSKGELRRLAEQGGIKIDGQKIEPEMLNGYITTDSLITVGKRRAYAVKG
jgi:tyrosyl-tRNA synthetase